MVVWPDDIVKTVSEYYNIPVHIMLSRTRKREAIKAVHAFWYLGKQHLTKNNRELAEMMNRKSHADVLHACKSVRNLIETDKYYRSDMNRIVIQLLKRVETKGMMHYILMARSQ
jgi:chromosomal replication initiator protein